LIADAARDLTGKPMNARPGAKDNTVDTTHPVSVKHAFSGLSHCDTGGTTCAIVALFSAQVAGK